MYFLRFSKIQNSPPKALTHPLLQLQSPKITSDTLFDSEFINFNTPHEPRVKSSYAFAYKLHCICIFTGANRAFIPALVWHWEMQATDNKTSMTTRLGLALSVFAYSFHIIIDVPSKISWHSAANEEAAILVQCCSNGSEVLCFESLIFDTCWLFFVEFNQIKIKMNEIAANSFEKLFLTTNIYSSITIWSNHLTSVRKLLVPRITPYTIH